MDILAIALQTGHDWLVACNRLMTVVYSILKITGL